MSLLERLTRVLQSVVGRLFLSHLIVGALTTLFIALLLVIVAALDATSFRPADYTSFAEDAAVAWLMPNSAMQQAALERATTSFTPDGYAMLISPSHQVLYTEGAAPCQLGSFLEDCAPDFIAKQSGETFVEIAGEQWVDVVLVLSTADRIILRLESPNRSNILQWFFKVFPEIVGQLLQLSVGVSLLSIPASTLLVWLFARPLVQRIAQIAQVSQRFADGDLMARLSDPRQDELGKLAQQFDSMADTLQQNIVVLRDLLKTNARLSTEIEATTIQAERLRLARDLHDDLAQRLFSLALSTAAMPELIERDKANSLLQARQIASLMEETLSSVRTLLLDLRPSGLLESGLAQSLKRLCKEWEQKHAIRVDLSIMLSRADFSIALQTVLYQIAQESLNNIAKHAQASQVVIALIEGRQQLVLSISDNGRGLSPEFSNQDGHFGILSMRERAESLGGTLFIESETGNGTTIRTVLAIQES